MRVKKSGMKHAINPLMHVVYERILQDQAVGWGGAGTGGLSGVMVVVSGLEVVAVLAGSVQVEVREYFHLQVDYNSRP